MKQKINDFFIHYRYLLLAALCISILSVSCKKDHDDTPPPPPAAPVINSIITPGGLTAGPKNTILTLKGKNFPTDLSLIQVTINGHVCQLISVTDSTIQAKVPPACGSGNVVLIVGGVSYTGPVFSFIYTYMVTSFTNGTIGYVDGPFSTAKIEEFVGIAIDGNDNIYNAQYSNPRVRKISPDSTVSTMAGNGVAGHVNGNGTAAQLSMADMVSCDAAGNVYVAENNGHIRKIDVNKNVTDFYTGTSADQFEGIKVMPSGNIYVAAFDKIGKISSAGVLTWYITSASGTDVDGSAGTASFNLYGGIDVSADESKIYVGDFSHGTTNNKVKVYDIAASKITTIAGNSSLTDGEGDALNVGFKLISCVLLDKNGGLYIADAFNNKIKYLKDGKVSTFIGAAGLGDADGDLSVAQVSYPHGLAFDSHGNLFISCVTTNKLKKVTID